MKSITLISLHEVYHLMEKHRWNKKAEEVIVNNHIQKQKMNYPKITPKMKTQILLRK